MEVSCRMQIISTFNFLFPTTFNSDDKFYHNKFKPEFKKCNAALTLKTRKHSGSSDSKFTQSHLPWDSPTRGIFAGTFKLRKCYISTVALVQ